MEGACRVEPSSSPMCQRQWALRAVEGACGWEGWRPANSTSSGEDGVCGERLLTPWTRRQPSGQVEELAFSFFAILARSLSCEILLRVITYPIGLEHSLPPGELGRGMSTAVQRPARDTLSYSEAGLN